MLALAFEDSDFGWGPLFRLRQAHHDKPAIALNLNVQYISCSNPGLLSGLSGDDHLTSIINSGYHAKRIGQAILAVNLDHPSGKSLKPASRMHNEDAKTQRRRDCSDRHSQDDALDCIGRAFELRSSPFRLDVPRGCA